MKLSATGATIVLLGLFLIYAFFERKKPGKVLSLAVILTFFLSTIYFLSKPMTYEQWPVFKSNAGNFSVKFPGSPHVPSPHSSTPLRILDLISVKVGTGIDYYITRRGITYGVTAYKTGSENLGNPVNSINQDNPGKIDNPVDLVEQTVRAEVGSSPLLEDKVEIELGAREIIFDSGSGVITAERIVVGDPYLYILRVDLPAKDYHRGKPKQYEYFFDSFKLIK